MIRSTCHVTGLFTSPHLQDLRERIQVNGEIISKQSFAKLLYDLRPAIESAANITYFEIMTILAMEYFARQNVDIAILEVGLGGRLDATNVVTPKVCAITTISYDHMDILGNTIMEIATEEAGIIKSGVPIVSGPQLDLVDNLSNIFEKPLYTEGVLMAGQGSGKDTCSIFIIITNKFHIFYICFIPLINIKYYVYCVILIF